MPREISALTASQFPVCFFSPVRKAARPSHQVCSWSQPLSDLAKAAWLRCFRALFQRPVARLFFRALLAYMWGQRQAARRGEKVTGCSRSSKTGLGCMAAVPRSGLQRFRWGVGFRRREGPAPGLVQSAQLVNICAVWLAEAQFRRAVQPSSGMIRFQAGLQGTRPVRCHPFFFRYGDGGSAVESKPQALQPSWSVSAVWAGSTNMPLIQRAFARPHLGQAHFSRERLEFNSASRRLWFRAEPPLPAKKLAGNCVEKRITSPTVNGFCWKKRSARHLGQAQSARVQVGDHKKNARLPGASTAWLRPACARNRVS